MGKVCGSAFPTHVADGALTSGARADSPALTCIKMDVVRIMTIREEKPVSTFTTTRLKVDWEVLCYPECGCLKGIQT